MGVRVQWEEFPGLSFSPMASATALFIPLTLFQVPPVSLHAITLTPTSAQGTAQLSPPTRTPGESPETLLTA